MPNRRVKVKDELQQPTKFQFEETKANNILDQFVFGNEVYMEKCINDHFFSNYSKIIDIAKDMYDLYFDDFYGRGLQVEELYYYATALLHFRLLEAKYRSHSFMTDKERLIRLHVCGIKFNIPSPLYVFLKEIGTLSLEPYGEQNLKAPALPVTVIQGFGGYHAKEVNEDNHNLFEEVPSLGIAGDMLMDIAALKDSVKQKSTCLRLGKPENSEFTENLVGLSLNHSPRGRDYSLTRGRLCRFNITAEEFEETFQDTRINLPYILYLSEIMRCLTKLKIYNTPSNIDGGVTQLILTRPKNLKPDQTWRTCVIDVLCNISAGVYVFEWAHFCGFQLFKEDGPGDTRSEKVANWSCVRGVGENPWVMPDKWYDNRNERRQLNFFFNDRSSICGNLDQKYCSREIIRKRLELSLNNN